jgi:hypothetical protein
MKLKASTAIEADTLGRWLTMDGFPFERKGFLFIAPTPDNASEWLGWLVRSAALSGDNLGGVQLAGE